MIKLEKSKTNNKRIIFKCECSLVFESNENYIINDIVNNCGCKSKIGKLRNNPIGKKFNNITILHFVGKDKYNIKYWMVNCDCGVKFISQLGNITKSKEATKDCGCSKLEHIKLIRKYEYEYNTYRSMKWRCNNNPNYKDINIHPPWLDKEKGFIKYIISTIGPRNNPEKYTIDRIDNKGYIPGNLRWAPKKEQSRNRKSVIINGITEANEIRNDWNSGEFKTLNELAKKYNCNNSTISKIIKFEQWKE